MMRRMDSYTAWRAGIRNESIGIAHCLNRVLFLQLVFYFAKVISSQNLTSPFVLDATTIIQRPNMPWLGGTSCWRFV